jgi:hypothetical protein
MKVRSCALKASKHIASNCVDFAGIFERRWPRLRSPSPKHEPLAGWSVHDLRRTVATGFQRLGVRLEVTGAVLNHISGSRGGIAGVYQLRRKRSI